MNVYYKIYINIYINIYITKYILRTYQPSARSAREILSEVFRTDRATNERGLCDKN